MSELAGRSTLQLKAAELGLELDSPALGRVLETLKHLEHAGYHFEAADGSLELLMRAAAGAPGRALRRPVPDRVVPGHHRLAGPRDGRRARPSTARAATRSCTRGPHRASSRPRRRSRSTSATSASSPPRRATGPSTPSTPRSGSPSSRTSAQLRNVHLTDYRVRVLDTAKGTGAVTRVLLDTADAEGSWSTIGVSENIIEASWQALVDAVVFGLVRAAEPAPGRARLTRRKAASPVATTAEAVQ